MPKELKNKGVSVRAKLLNLARERGQSNELILTRYALERLLYRLSISPYADRFVLKGAMLMTVWFDVPYRATRDIDFLGFGDSEADAILATFKEICGIDAGDGVEFDTEKLAVDTIRDELAYGGLRLRTIAFIAGARVTVSIDIGFGDAIEPGLEELDYPVMLDEPAPHLRVYPPETVIAEKFQAIVALGQANSRMKDFFDVWLLLRESSFTGDRLPRAIAATFQRRTTEIPTEVPDGLSDAFSGDPAKLEQWKAFGRNIEGDVPIFSTVVTELREKMMAFATEARKLPRG